MAHHAGEARNLLFIELERLADIARRRATAITDDVRRHRCAKLSIAFVDVLDHALALVARRKIEINVRPLVAIVVQKSLEQ